MKLISGTYSSYIFLTSAVSSLSRVFRGLPGGVVGEEERGGKEVEGKGAATMLNFMFL